MPASRSATGTYLTALTPEGARTFGARAINIPHFPFRIGRESRRLKWTEQGLVGEKRRAAPPNNDLYLVEELEPMNVSREHFLIGRDDHGYFVLDRGSACGTLVEGEAIGAQTGNSRAPLHDHDVIIVGTSLSRFIFKFRLEA